MQEEKILIKITKNEKRKFTFDTYNEIFTKKL